MEGKEKRRREERRRCFSVWKAAARTSLPVQPGTSQDYALLMTQSSEWVRQADPALLAARSHLAGPFSILNSTRPCLYCPKKLKPRYGIPNQIKLCSFQFSQSITLAMVLGYLSALMGKEFISSFSRVSSYLCSWLRCFLIDTHQIVSLEITRIHSLYLDPPIWCLQSYRIL